MNYHQKHPETCLSKCLIILTEKLKKIEIPAEYELELLIYSLKHGFENIAKGHLEKITKDFSLQINRIAGSEIFFEFTKNLGIEKNIFFSYEKINLKLIDNLAYPIIIYVDRFYLWNESQHLYFKYHYPHFIIITRKVDINFYEIIDPDDGQIKIISRNILSKSINSLKNHLRISPQIIEIVG